MAKAKKAAKGKIITIKVVPDEALQSRRLYANYVDVHHTPYDFSIRFSDAHPVFEVEKIKNDGEYNVPVVVEVAIPTDLMPALIDALQKQHEKYLDTYGKEKSREKK